MDAASLASAEPGAMPPPAGKRVAVVGSGVAGLTATLRLLDSGARVMLFEKEKRLGGNSAKASSGINAWTSTRADAHANDTLATFVADTAKSALRDAGFAHTARMIALL